MPKCYHHSAAIDLPMQKNIIRNGITYPFRALVGSIQAKFINRNGIVQTGVMGTYAHSTISLTATPSANIGFPGGASAGLGLELSSGLSESSSDELVISVT